LFDELLGLPAHPLLVHLPVVLVPVTALLAVAYALAPPLRRRVDGLLVLMALAVPAVTWAAIRSGEALTARLGGETPAITRHAVFGDRLLYLSLALTVLAVAAVAVDRRRRSTARAADHPDGLGTVAVATRSRQLGMLSVALSVLLPVVAVLAAVQAVQAGHSGAEMVWGGG